MTTEADYSRVTIEASTDVSAVLSVQYRFAKQHFQGASFFVDCAERLESKIRAANPRSEEGKPQHRAYIVGAIVSSVMALEARINEVYLDACHKSENNLAGLDGAAMSLLGLWWAEIEARPILLKYQHALLLLGKDPLPKGKNPYQDADNLIHLRNALTHYKQELDDSLDVHADLQSRLTDRFDLSPLSTKSNLWFPHQCLGSGCAKWAVSTAEALVTAFCTRLGIKTRI